MKIDISGEQGNCLLQVEPVLQGTHQDRDCYQDKSDKLDISWLSTTT